MYRLLYKLVRGNSCTTQEIAQNFGVSRRTVERYIEELKMAGVPVVSSRGMLGMSTDLAIDYDYTLGLSAREKKILLLASNLAEKYFGNIYSQDIENTVLKIRESLSSDPFFHKYEEPIQYYTILEPRRENIDIKVIEILEAAMVQKQVVKFFYRHPGGNCRAYVVEPYRFVFSDEHWFLFSRDVRRNRRFFLRISRISPPVERLPKRFSMPTQDAIERSLSRVFGTHYTDTEHRITIWFSREVARIIRDTVRHPSQSIRENPDGSIHYTIRVCGYQEVISWVLSYGSKAKVLAPRWIAEKVAKEIELMHKLYKS